MDLVRLSGRVDGLLIQASACAVIAASFILLLAAMGSGRRAALAGTRPWAPLAFTAAAVAASVLALAPFAPGGAHPLWSLVAPPAGAGLPAAALDRGDQLFGLLGLAALAALALATAATFRGREAERSLVQGIMVVAAVAFAAWGAAGRGALGLAAPRDAGAGIDAFGAVLLVLAVAEVFQRRRSSRTQDAGGGRTFLAALRSAPAATAAALAAVIVLSVLGRGPGLVVGAVCAGLPLLWEALTGRQERGRRASLLLLSVMLLSAAAALAWIVARLLAAPDSAAEALAWDGFTAQPWLGEGLGSWPRLLKLGATRLNLAELAAGRAPSGLALALQQGGLLVAAPVALSVAWIWARLVRSVARRSRGAAMARTVTSSVLALGVLGMIEPGPLVAGAGALLALLVGAALGLSADDAAASDEFAPARRRTLAPAIGSAILGAGAFAGVVVAAAALAALLAPGAPFAGGVADALGLGAVREARAGAALARSDAATAAAEAAAATATGPARADAWLTLARAEAALRRPVALAAALASGYDVEPYAKGGDHARLLLALQAFSQLPTASRTDVDAELRSLQTAPAERSALRGLRTHIADPEGRAALEAALASEGGGPLP